ncbi:MAG: 23S rRNA (uracil(1939)-C(5))-methyltransferase RlmD [Terracidiphilus sp.]
MTQPDPQLVQIEKPIYGGAFLARVEGKAVFVPLTLPGEQARIRIVEDKRGYASAEAVEIVAPAPERIAPACRHFGACGGCDYQHASYQAQLRFKQSILRETLERGGVRPPEEIAVLSAEPWAWRNRIRLAFDAQGNPGYRGRRSHAVIPIAECPIAAPLLVRAAQAIAEIVGKSSPLLRPSEISLFCDAQETSLLAGLYTVSPAKIPLEDFCRALAGKIPQLKGAEYTSEGRSGRPLRKIAQWGATSLDYHAAGFAYRVDHGAFFQVNRWLVDVLVDQVTANQRGALAWDLFAGVGLFARRLASTFNRVVAVESAPSATAALAHNLNNTSATAVNAATLDFLRRTQRSKRPDLIVVDPPRTGLGAETTTLLAHFAAPALVYVSCDPATLARDLRTLIASGYAIEKITLADLFPQTFHLETVVHLRR